MPATRIVLRDLWSGCDRYVRITKEMAWECDPGKADPKYPDAEPVVFRYPEDPEYFDLASDRGLCQQLRSSGQKMAKVTYEVWGTTRGLHGYRIESVNGQSLQDIGGPAGNGRHGRGNGGPHPLLRALKGGRWRARRDSNSRPTGSKPAALST